MKYLKLLYELYCLKRRRRYSAEKMKSYQNKKLKDLLEYAFHNSDYYHNLYAKAGITEENIKEKQIWEFPSIDKKDLISNFDSLITVKDVTQQELREFDENVDKKEKLFKEKYHLVHSSGSTGTPAFFLYDENAWQVMLSGIVRAALWDMSLLQIGKLLTGKPSIMYIAATDGRYGGAMAVGDGIDGLHLNQMHLNVQSPIEEWIEKVNKFKPDIIIGYPSAVKILAQLKDEGKIKMNLTRLITCGEPLSDNMSEIFHNTYGCPVINVYGASESLALGVGITGSQGISLFDDLNLIEIMDNKIYLTCLYNYAQPVIRYQLSDELEKIEADSPFTTVKTILGRNEDLMWFQNHQGEKEFLHPLSVEGICVKGLKDYQFRKINNCHFEMIAEIETNADEEKVKQAVLEKMYQVLEEKKLNFVKFSIRISECIYPDEKTGKKKLILV